MTTGHDGGKRQRRVILATIGSAGDVNPMMALGLALQQRGHDVLLVTSPFFEEYIESAGLPFMPLGDAEAHRRVVEDPDLWNTRRAFDVIARGVILPSMRPFYEMFADVDPAGTLLVTSALVFGAHLLRERRGMAHVTVHLQPSLLRSLYQSPNMGGIALPEWLPKAVKRLYFRLVDRLVIDRQLAPKVNAFRAELGLPAIHNLFAGWIHSPLLNLGLFPDWFAPPQPDWPASTRLTGFLAYDGGEQQPVTAEVRAFLAAGEPPIVFTAGTSNVHAAAFLRESARAAALLKRRALLVNAYPEQLPDELPEGVMATTYAPFGELLPRASALVYHGGVGTLAQALAAGIPHLVMPLSHDQPDNADRLRRLGLGDAIAPGRYRAELVAEKLGRLLADEQVAERCRQLAAQVDFAAGLQEAVTAIEALR